MIKYQHTSVIKNINYKSLINNKNIITYEQKWKVKENKNLQRKVFVKAGCTFLMLYLPLNRLPGCPCHDFCWIWFPHDLPETLQLRWCGLQLPSCRLWLAVGSSHARLVPHARPHHWKNLYRSREVSLFIASFLYTISHLVNCKGVGGVYRSVM